MSLRLTVLHELLSSTSACAVPILTACCRTFCRSCQVRICL